MERSNNTTQQPAGNDATIPELGDFKLVAKKSTEKKKPSAPLQKPKAGLFSSMMMAG